MRTRVGVLVAGALLVTLALGGVQSAFAYMPPPPPTPEQRLLWSAEDASSSARDASDSAGIAMRASEEAKRAAETANANVSIVVGMAVVVSLLLVLALYLLFRLHRAQVNGRGGSSGL